MITQRYNLDLIPNGVPLVVHCSRYDQNSRTLRFDLFYNGVTYSIPTGTTVTIRGTKPDNTGFEYPCTFNGSAVSVNIKDQMTVIAGVVPCEIRLVKNSEILGTANFVLRVEKSALDEGVVISETDLPLLESAEQYAIRAEQAAERAERAAGDIVGLDLKSVIFFGDSYVKGTQAVGSDLPPSDTWCGRLANLLDIPKWQKWHCGGGGFAHVSSSLGRTFVQQWNEWVAGTLAPDGAPTINTDATTIFIMGGWNDKDQTEAAIESGIIALINAIRNTFPASQTKIVYLFNPSLGLPLLKTITTCYRVARNMDCICIGDSWYWQFGEEEDYGSDLVHPTNPGHRRIAQYIYTTLCGGEVFHRRLIDLNDVEGSTDTCNLIVENDTVFLYVNAVKDAGESPKVIGHIQPFMRAGWEGRWGPTFRVRELQAFDDTTGVNMGYVRMGYEEPGIFVYSMKKIDDPTVWSSGRMILARDYQLLELLG